MDRLYHWRNFVNNKYVALEGNDSSINLHTIPHEVNSGTIIYPLCKTFLKTYKTFQIPTHIEEKLDELLERFNTPHLKSPLLIFGCALQESYSDNFDIPKDDLLKDFDVESKDFKTLLGILRNYLFAENRKHLPDVSFKTFTEGTTTIKNFFVKHDIYDALCHSFNLKKENFEERSQELLAMTNQIMVDKYPEKVKVDFIQALFNYIGTETELTKSDILKLIGVFFTLFQVKVSNSKDTEFYIHNYLEDNIKSVDLKNLNHYITRPPILFHY
ncbi:hypothetical protein LS482_11090 [Sinomicrobium kalidii]|uniref:hypothetical protein n=1 Tax=Sinomicrobium kalidii TaxID=2900738 RepID=UPI001E3C7704|nr:hypothetical protein [Sinomicrobium kalidii]UGU14258.1 hypothetical protein LS482_11090 [Sinomicrobium kalidii]